jgi:hypothetical protein
MTKQVESGRTALQQFARRQQENSLRLLKQYVESRQKTFEVFSRLEQDSKHALEAKALLEKAQAEYDALAASIGALAASLGATSEANEDKK